MKTLTLLMVISTALGAPGGTGPSAAGKLRVVATTQDLAALARAIGGDAVEVTALAKPTEDQHYVDAKPSHIVSLNRADVLIEGGAELELGWLPPLLVSSRNDKIAPGAPGRIVAAEGIRMLDVPLTFDRSKGDLHALGNPHFLLDPVNVKIIVTQMAEHFAQVDPASAGLFNANLNTFVTALDAKLAEWLAQLAPYQGAKLVTYHPDFVYLAERFQLQVVATLEPKPGIAPSPAHLAKVISTMRAANARVILVQPYQNRRTAETVARQTNAVVLDLAQQPGGLPNTNTYFDLMDHMIKTLVAAFRETAP